MGHESSSGASSLRLFGIGLLVAFLLFVLNPGAVAQLSQGSIQGTVKDTSGAAVPDATVTVVNTGTNESRTTVTGEDGLFRVPALQPGNYTIRVEKSGFKTSSQTGLALEVAQQLVTNPTLEVGATSQQVVVTGEAAVVNTTSAALGGLVNDQSIADLPLNGRNFIDLTLLQPGVSSNSSRGGQSTVGTWFSANGASTFSNWITIDGAPMNTQFGGATGSQGGTTLGVDGIKEYRVVTSNFSSDYGMTTGSHMVILSKSGTNQFHGDAFEYIRNSSLDSRNYFDTVASAGKNLEGVQRRLPNFQRNNFGGSFGGPIKKDKTFFYAVYEGLRQNLGVTASDVVLPLACHQLLNPGTSNTTLVNPTACAPTLTSKSIVPQVIQPILSLIPVPNNGTTGFVLSGQNILNENFGQIRFDQNISSSDSFFARYTMDNAEVNNGSGSLNAVSSTVANSFPQYFSLTAPSRNQFLTIGENHVFSPTLLNTASLSFSRTVFSSVISAAPATIGPTVSYAVGNPVGRTVIGGTVFGTPLNAGPNPPPRHLQNIYTFSDDVFYTHGKNAFKFGVLINRFNQGIGPNQEPAGQVTYSGVAAFVTGIYSSYVLQSSSLASSYDYIYNTFGFYAQDDWRATSRLTLNLGLRYEFNTTPYELNGLEFSIRNIQTDTAPTPGPLIDNRSQYNFSPRLGFAYDLRGDGKTAIRGAFGLYYDIGNFGAALSQGIVALPPLENQGTFTNTTNAVLPNLPLPYPTGGASLHTINYQIGEPHLLEYNLSVERQLPASTALSVSYVGSRRINLFNDIEENPFVASSFVNGLPVWDAFICNGVLSAYQPTGVSCSANPGYHRINTKWGSAIVGNTNSASWYNALQVVATKRLTQGLQFQASYTYAKDLDLTQGQLFAGDCFQTGAMATGVDPFNKSYDKGPACSDLRHNFRFNTLYHFPKVNAEPVVSKLVNGWWVGTIFSAQTGYPVALTEGTNRSLSGEFTGQVVDERPNINTAASIAANPCTSQPGQPAAGSNPCAYTPIPFNINTVVTGNPNQWFNPAMFSLQPIGTLGNSSRGQIYGPGLFDWDFSLAKDTSVPWLGEAGNVEFRADFFNVLNHTNFAMQNAATVIFAGSTTASDAGAYSEVPSATFGKPGTTATNARQIQFALKIIF